MALNNKQLRFCQEYVVDSNATQAAIRAGYSKKTAYEIGSQNLRKVEIQKKISELQAKLSAKAEISAEKVINEFAKLAFWDGKSLKGMKYSDKIQALNNLGKHLGIFERDNEQLRPVSTQLSDTQFTQLLTDARKASTRKGK